MAKKNIKVLSVILILTFVISPLKIYAMQYEIATDRERGQASLSILDYNGNFIVVPCYATNIALPNNKIVPVAIVSEDMSAYHIPRFHEEYDSVSANSDRLYTATAFYNCHSYAWYSQNTTTNQYWISNPSGYYNCGLYYEVSTPLVGDIICYMDNNETPGNAADDTNIHSGIIVEVYDFQIANGLAGEYTVESKWGGGGLYRHNGYECLFTDYYSENGADYVKFYRRSGHTHNFNTYNDNGNNEYHQSICSCGMIVHKAHNWVLHYGKSSGQRAVDYLPEYYCSLCGAFTTNP